jgi:hypothetical protein
VQTRKSGRAGDRQRPRGTIVEGFGLQYL